MARASCHRCSTPYEVEERPDGKTFRCRKCGVAVHIPAGPEAGKPAPPPARTPPRPPAVPGPPAGSSSRPVGQEPRARRSALLVAAAVASGILLAAAAVWLGGLHREPVEPPRSGPSGPVARESREEEPPRSMVLDPIRHLEEEEGAFLDDSIAPHSPGPPEDTRDLLEEESGSKSESKKGRTRAPPPPRVEPAGLGLGSDEGEAILGAAISLASGGRLEEAISRLRQAGAGGKGTLALRMEREIERIEEAGRLRDEILEQAARSRGVIEVAKTRGRVEKLDAEKGVIHLRVGGKVKELGLAELTAEGLRQAAEAEQLLEGSRSWLGAYLLLLGGQDPRSVLEHRYMKDQASARARDLREDITNDFERLRALGDAARILDDLSRRVPPTHEDADSAADALSQVKTLAERHGSSELVLRRRQELRIYAEALLDRTFDRMDPDCLGVHGQVEQGTDDAIILTYFFEDPIEAEDFIPEKDYLAEWRREMQSREGLREVKQPESSSFVIEDGALSGTGATSCRLLLPFAAPFQVTYVVSCSEVDPPDEKFVFVVGACDDGRGMGVRCSLTGDMLVFSDQHVGQLQGAIRNIVPDQPYYHEIRHDGESIEFQAGPGTVKLEGAGGLERGSLFFWIHANFKVRITKLEIEATLDEESLRAAKRRWIERQLEELF